MFSDIEYQPQLTPAGSPASAEVMQLLSNAFVEIEVKLTGDAGVLNDLFASEWLAAMQTGPASSEALVTHYFDTPEFALRREGLVLRLRWNGKKWTQCLKARSNARNGIYRRREMETTVPTDKPDFATLCGDQGVLKALGVSAERIQHLFSTRFTRTTLHLKSASRTSALPSSFTLSRDIGWIEMLSQKQPISEVEVELVDGPEKGMLDFARSLTQRYPLVRGTLSKADRGYRLLGKRTAPKP